MTYRFDSPIQHRAGWFSQILNNYSHENDPLFSTLPYSRCFYPGAQHWANFANRLRANVYRPDKLIESPPGGFQALVYPVADQSGRIRVNFDNGSPGSVRIQVRDQQEKIVYDEFESSVRYRGFFDLSFLPAGDYTLSLSKPQGAYSRTFRIEPPTASRIALLNKEPATESPKSEKLIASH